MADDAIIDLLDKSELAFSLASEVGLDLSRTIHQLIRTGLNQTAREQRHKTLIRRSLQLKQLRACLRDLQGNAHKPQDGFASVAERLRRTSRVVFWLCEAGKVTQPDKLLRTLHYLHTVGERSRSIVTEARLQLDAGWSWAVPRAPLPTADPVCSGEANALEVDLTADSTARQGVEEPAEGVMNAAGRNEPVAAGHLDSAVSLTSDVAAAGQGADADEDAEIDWTIPMSKKQAAVHMGYRGSKKAEWINKCGEDGTLPMRKCTRQSFQFGLGKFPKDQQDKLRATGTK